LPVWEQSLHLLGGADFISALPLAAELPWDFIELNFRKPYLVEEYRRSLAAEPTRPCAELDCATCAGCVSGQKKVRPAAWSDAPAAALAPPAAGHRRLRLGYEKKGPLRFLSHLAMMQFLERLLRKSGLLFQYSQGFHPRIKMAALPPLPVGAEGEAEVIEVQVAVPPHEDAAGDLTVQEVLAALNRRCRNSSSGAPSLSPMLPRSTRTSASSRSTFPGLGRHRGARKSRPCSLPATAFASPRKAWT